MSQLTSMQRSVHTCHRAFPAWDRSSTLWSHSSCCRRKAPSWQGSHGQAGWAATHVTSHKRRRCPPAPPHTNCTSQMLHSRGSGYKMGQFCSNPLRGWSELGTTTESHTRSSAAAAAEHAAACQGAVAMDMVKNDCIKWSSRGRPRVERSCQVLAVCSLLSSLQNRPAPERCARVPAAAVAPARAHAGSHVK